MCDMVGIIEQGRMLAVGTVADIHRLHRTHSEVRVRVLERAAELAQWLSAHAVAQQPRADGDQVLFAHEGDEQTEAALLREIVQAGFPVSAFGATRKSLEDVFMALVAEEVS